MKSNQLNKLTLIFISISYIFEIVQSKDNPCEENQIYYYNEESSRCLNEKKECPEYISINGKKCESSCTDSPSESYIETFENYKQCRLCRDFIKYQKGEQVQCVTECDKNEMIYVYGDFNEFKKCVSQDFCQSRYISAKEPNVCHDQCLQPEVYFQKKCREKCPDGLYTSMGRRGCQDSCVKVSSNKQSCTNKCEFFFEYTDNQSEDNVCKKCQKNEYLSFENPSGECKPIEKSVVGREQMRIQFKNGLQNIKFESIEQLEAAEQVISNYATVVEEMLKEISNKDVKTQQDQTLALSELTNLLQLNQYFYVNFQNKFSNKAKNFGTSELITISQMPYPGLKFKTSFNSKDIVQGSTLSLLEKDNDELTPKFSPDYLQVSFLKNNIYCEGTQCKKYPPLYFITQPHLERRQLAEDTNLQFQLIHDIPSAQDPSKFLCLTYDVKGNLSRQKGEIKNNQISCKFEYSSALFYDENCEFVDKQNCVKKPDIKEQDNNNENVNINSNEDDELSGGAIAGIVIGVIAVLGIGTVGLIYTIRARKAKSIKNKQNAEFEKATTAIQ